jgi:KH domain
LFTPSSVLPFIIGKKGVNLKNIQDLSGAIVKVPKREDSEAASVAASAAAEDEVEDDLVEITIEGIDAAVAKAKEEILKIVDEKVST